MTVFGRLTLFLALAGAAQADVTPAALFVDGAVLQRDKAVPVWGRAEPGENVSVLFAAQQRNTTADATGRWTVSLDALPASVEGADLTISGKNVVVVRNVVVGEVWLCAGQANMQWPVSRAANAAAEIAAARFPLVRQIALEPTVATTPTATVKTSGWIAAAPETVGAFSAVGYFFARELHQKLGVPIGIIHASSGNSPIEAWMSAEALGSDPAFAVVAQRWQAATLAYPAAKADYEGWLAKWTPAEATARAQGDKLYRPWLAKNPPRYAPVGAPGDSWTPAGHYNGMIHPLVPYALRGALWYQGESNAERANEYHALFSTLIAAWRFHFAQGDFPFYWVNLAGFRAPADPTGLSYAVLREAQTKTLNVPNTGQAIAIDLGEPDNLYPANKQDVARRLALLAKARVYGIIDDDTGPTFVSATREPLTGRGGVGLRVRFEHTEGGLVAHNKPIPSLELAGADRVFHPAVARIDQGTLLVTSPQVHDPVAVRYAWRNAPEANLYNGAGLPAVPFRSDDW